MRQNIFRTNDRVESRLPLHSLQTQRYILFQNCRKIHFKRCTRIYVCVLCSFSYNNHSRLLQNPEMSALCTYTFLEQQISASLVLKSAQEFRHWLLTMVQFLLQQGVYSGFNFTF